MEAPPAPATPQKTQIVIAVLLTLAVVVVFQQFFGTHRSADYDQRAKRSEALISAQERQNQKYDEYYHRIEENQKRTQALIEAQERANARFQQVLDTWERQQKEYQVYLDSLKQ